MVKQGYKQTEIGIIPKDWSLSCLEKHMKIETGSRNTEHRNENGKYPFFVRSQQVERIDTYHYDCEAVLTAGDGVGTGKVFHYINGKFDAHQRVYVMYQFQDIEAKYFFYYFKENFYNEVSKYTAKSSVDSVRRDMIAKMIIPLPPLPEQKVIAEALSDADGLIASLEKLIEKKKAIKQGAMQQLLTGKRRLPGFSGEWVKMNLFEKSKLKARIGWQGLTTAEYLTEGYSYLITGTDFINGTIDWANCHYVEKKRYDQDPNIQIINGDILITKDGTIGKVAFVKGLSYPATLNSGVFVIRPLKEGNYFPGFVFYVMSSSIFNDFLNKLSAGSTISHLYQKDFVGFEFFVPPTLDEQIAIANILSDMDNEIEALQKKLAKIRNLKQGMMQELLTGRIRLVDTEEKAPPQAAPVTVVKKEQSRQGHNKHFEDAVLIAAIVDAFYSDMYPLGRVKIQKLLYLLRRKQEASVAEFKKKAAGPYADEVRYKGGEPIAKANKYIVTSTSEKGTRYGKGEYITQSLGYIEKWNMQDDINWLKNNFLHTSRNELELLATIDMAMCDLTAQGKEISIANIKELIRSDKEWNAKLKKAYFSDIDIQRAIKENARLFG